MQSSLWKLAVIAGVVALCLLVIDHARKDMANSPANPGDDVVNTDNNGAKPTSEPSPESNVGQPQAPLKLDDKSNGNIENVGHTENHSGDEIGQVTQTLPAVPVVDPFEDGGAGQPRPLGNEGLPLAGQVEPADDGIGEIDRSVPELWSDAADVEVAEDSGVTVPVEEFSSFDDSVFDAADAATAQEESLEPLPEEMTAEGEESLDDSPAELLTAEDQTTPVATDSDVYQKSLELPPVTDQDPFEVSPSQPDPFEDDIGLPTAGDLDAPTDELSPDDFSTENLTEEMPAEELGLSADDFSVDTADDTADDAVEAIETFDSENLPESADPAETETADSTSPDQPTFLADNALEDPALEEPPLDAIGDGGANPEIITPEPLSADDFDAGIAAEDDLLNSVDEPFDTRGTDTDDVAVEAPPLLPIPETDDFAPGAMLADETEPIAVEPAESEPAPTTEADEFSAEPLDETPDELTIEPVPEPDDAEPELLPAETVPARQPEIVPPTTEAEEVPDPEPAEKLESSDEDVLGDGTVDANSPHGPQKPQLTIEKQSPPTAVLGKPFIYSILIKNVGQSPAGRVTVEDEIPRGAKLTGTIPQAELVGKKLIWKFGTLEPNQERKISIRVIPISEGPIGSVATVNFVAEVAAQTVVQKPKLDVTIIAPKEAPLGKPVVFQFKVVNTGSMVAKKVVLRDILPNHFTHPGGKDLEYEIGDLAGGQTRDVQLTLTAAEVGTGVNQATVTAEGDISAKAEATVNIVDQGISIIRVGPKSRLLRRATSFTNSIRNKAKSPVEDIVVVEQIPEGMKFLKASQGGNYDPQKKTVTWHIQQIAGEETEDVSVMLLPEAPGNKASVISVFGETGQIGTATAETAIRGFAMLDVEISHAEQPAEIGERISYRIEIQNRGTEAATGVLVSALIPEEMQVVSIKGPLEHQQTERQIDFSAIANLAPNQHIAVDVLLEAQAAGDARLQVQMQSDQMQKPLNREAATIIFADQK